MKAFALIAVLVFTLWVGWSAGYKGGLEEGHKQALKLDPPSERLELVCAALWVSEQSKRWHERRKK